MKISQIAARSKNGVIGNENDIPWRIPGEQKRFKDLTLGHTVIMGRKTYESIGKPLPKRKTIIVSRDPHYKVVGCVVVHSIEEALKLTEAEEEVFIGGGESIYRASLPYTDRIYLTEIDFEVNGDTRFPDLPSAEFKEIERQLIPGEPAYSYLTLERVFGRKNLFV
jgi:dihydrofolate reductase